MAAARDCSSHCAIIWRPCCSWISSIAASSNRKPGGILDTSTPATSFESLRAALHPSRSPSISNSSRRLADALSRETRHGVHAGTEYCLRQRREVVAVPLDHLRILGSHPFAAASARLRISARGAALHRSHKNNDPPSSAPCAL